MSANRELLELAAKAAALPLEWRTGRDGTDIPRSWVLGKEWLPADDDGDSRRLEVRLGIHMQFASGFAVAYAGSVHAKQFTERIGSDELAATRMAVLRAAAEIGRAMP